MDKTLVTLVAALKRNDRVATTASVLAVLGYKDRAAEAAKATRATTAFFDRSFEGLLNGEMETKTGFEVDPEPEEAQTIWYYKHPESGCGWCMDRPLTKEEQDGLTDEIDKELYETMKASGEWACADFPSWSKSPKEKALEEVEETEEVVEAPKDALTISEIKTLVVNGHIKKAKKAFKAQFSKKHPNYKELKKLIKEAK